MNEKFDFYYSDQHHCLLKNSNNYKKPTVLINGKVCVFTEITQHGEYPQMPFADKSYIGTTTLDKIKLEDAINNTKPKADRVQEIIKNIEKEVEKRKIG